MSKDQSTMTTDSINSVSRTENGDTAKQISKFKPKIIGVYGLPGCGKSTLLKQLKKELPNVKGLEEQGFHFTDGSEAIKNVMPTQEDGVDVMKAFRALSVQDQTKKRAEAITKIKDDCEAKRTHGIIAGHLLFQNEARTNYDDVWTQQDGKTYTHIIYLDVDAETIQSRRANDETRSRPELKTEQLMEWQSAERKKLRQVCYECSIPLSVVHGTETASKRIVDFVLHDAKACEHQAVQRAKDHLNRPQQDMIRSALVMDADKTLSAQDAGKIFGEALHGFDDDMTEIFSSGHGYKASAFYQVMLKMEEMLPYDDWEELCEETATKITIHAEFVELLSLASAKAGVEVVVVTCGIGRVWEKVLARYGFGDVSVIGGGRLKDGIIVTPEVKRRIVEFLQVDKNAFVWAFGDSQLDLPMLEQADEAVVVVCDEKTRSKSMEEKLTISVEKSGLHARQLLLPSSVKPRLNGKLLPVVHPADLTFEMALTSNLQIIHATNSPACKMLTAPTRTIDIKGLALQKAHHTVGFYLATELLSKATGVEKTNITSVQGHASNGHRIRNQEKTVIVSCMRGGDPIAQGVFAALPPAIYVHASDPTDLQNKKHVKAVQEAKTILLCDFVVNNGETMIDMVKKIRGEMKVGARIVMIAGVVQGDSVKEGGGLVVGLKGYQGVSLVALRLSANKYTGKGNTDTGSRLFNTTKVEQ